jgi:2-dehydropantoate 2-reductase
VGRVLTGHRTQTESLQKVEEPDVESSRTEPPGRSDPLDVGVVGAGAIGSTFGAYLTAGGFHVRFIDSSPARVAAINTGQLGLTSDAAAGRVLSIPPAAVAGAPTGPAFDVLLFTVKGYATEAAAAAVSSCLRAGGVVVSVQNGLGIHEQLARSFDTSGIAVGSTTVSAAVRESGDTQVAADTWLGRSRTILGAAASLAPGPAGILGRFTAALSASGLPAATSESVGGIIWTKLCYAVSIGTVCAVADTDIAGALGSSSGRHLVREIFGEVASVARAVGVPLDTEIVWQEALQFWSSIQDHVPSMAIDVRDGRPTEVDSFALGVARLGSDAGVSVAYCRSLGELIKMKKPPAKHGQ